MSLIRLPCYGISVQLFENAHPEDSATGTIVSDLKGAGDFAADAPLYNAAIDGLESLILAHACAGVEINAPAYIEGVETAVDAIVNHYL